MAAQKTTEQWRKHALHDVTCPSGMEVTVRIPNLAAMIKHDAIPDSLRQAALREVMNPGVPLAMQQPGAAGAGELTVTKEDVAALYELQELLVVEMLVDPKLTPPVYGPDPDDPEKQVRVSRGDLDDLPQEDLEMLVQIASRDRDVDAAGKKLGVMPLSYFATFRDEHGCGPDCEACQVVQGRLSTSRRDLV